MFLKKISGEVARSQITLDLFHAREEDALVLILKHGLGILTVGGRLLLLLNLKLESRFLDEVLDDLVGGLDAPLARHVGEMIEKGPKVDPAAAVRLQDPVNQLDEVQDVVGAVDKEAGDHAVLERTGNFIKE